MRHMRLQVAPEVKQHGCYSTACDQWGLGVLLYNLLSGEEAYGAHASRALGSPAFGQRVWQVISYEAKSLICGLLDPYYSMRLTAAQVRRPPHERRH